MTELKTSHYLKQRSDGRIEPYKPIVNKSDAAAGYVLTADGAGNADYAASIADATGVTAGHVLTADGADGASYVAPADTSWQNVSEVTPSGTSEDITGIPASATEIKITVFAVSADATARLSLQLGDSGGIEATGYVGIADGDTGAPSVNPTTEFRFDYTAVNSGITRFAIGYLYNDGSNQWTWNLPNCARNDGSVSFAHGRKTLSGTLDRVRLLLSAGNFTGGSVRVDYK